MKQTLHAVMFALLFVVGCSSTNTHDHGAMQADRPAPLFEGVGEHHHPVTTSSPTAQQYFDQGVVLCFGFNHPEAVRSFRAAQQVDPKCAMAYWGEAFALGPNINAPMPGDHYAKAWAAVEKARALRDSVTPRERAYIDAIAKRYTPEPVDDRAELDAAFMNAMHQVAGQYPDDLDAQTFYAEAIMDTMPWDYWQSDLKPKPRTEELLAKLEGVLNRKPDHMGAIHLYIHATEAGPTPRQAEPYADTLRDLKPTAAGHLIHMPSHIYVRTGRWHDALLTNHTAVKADESYIAQCKAQGFYPALYYSHNMHFVWYTASMLGRSNEALAAAKKMHKHVDHTHATDIAPHPGYWATVAPLALVRYGRWQAILSATPAGIGDPTFDRAVALYCRGVAMSQTQQLAEAQKQADALWALAQTDEAKALDHPAIAPGYQLVQIFAHLLDGHIAWEHGKESAAMLSFGEAVKLEEKLPYMEPPFMYYSTRLTAGAMALQAGKFADAERYYRGDLAVYPNNGYGLFGLAKALDAQGKAEEATQVRAQFNEAWRHADFKLNSTRF